MLTATERQHLHLTLTHHRRLTPADAAALTERLNLSDELHITERTNHRDGTVTVHDLHR